MTKDTGGFFLDRDEIFDILDQTVAGIAQSLLNCQKEAQECFHERLNYFFAQQPVNMVAENPNNYGWFSRDIPYTHIFLRAVTNSFAPFFVQHTEDAKTVQTHVALFTQNKDFLRYFLNGSQATNQSWPELFAQLNNHPYILMSKKERQGLEHSQEIKLFDKLMTIKKEIWSALTSSSFSEDDIEKMAEMAVLDLKTTLEDVLKNRREIIDSDRVRDTQTAPSDHVVILDNADKLPALSREGLKAGRENKLSTELTSNNTKGPI